MRSGEAQGPLRPAEVAVLAGNAWRALQVGYVMLWRRGRLIHDEQGRINRTGAAPRSVEPLERELFNAMLGWQGPQQAAERPRVEAALRQIRHGLVARRLMRSPYRRVGMPAVLVVVPGVAAARLTAMGALDPSAGIAVVLAGVIAAGWFFPRRTPRGSRMLQALRAQHRTVREAVDAGDGTATTMTPEALGMAVALSGDAALHVLLPADARGAGLLDGGRRDVTLPHQPSTGTTFDATSLPPQGL
ncbi:TIGR04222 domain-containing membrane protein [Dactylosporangium sp. AC04546]|uniref:TIGR04222 domain-containing membrane protein n=1 Tax=Dactylosporangium sp. AC04546 TaxID=2862460 RepID=UPI001EDCB6AD|nr:TIGR04222 domain-containing membrane protein [Dactylosporangium sp. AC04546]WVK78576.1 TIGR04222 domain-containing membrane protein [Dactylosporangium sp. AC04546]